MTRHLAAKLVESLIAILGVLTIVFFVTRIVGDPTALLLPVGATAEEMARLERDLGLDRPLAVQYLDMLGSAAIGDFGISFQQSRPAMDIVLERMPATMLLAFTALFFGVVLGAVAGTVAALMRGTVAELIVMAAALIGQATPVFWLGIMLILLFAVQLGWLPTGGYGEWRNLVMPAFTLAVFVSAAIARLLRSSILDILGEDYVRTARAKGLMPSTVFVWHVGRNSLIPVVTMTGIIAGELLGGSVVTETVFAWPGVGRLIVQAILAKDFPVVQAGIVVIAVMFVAINLAIDLLYGVLDPRIRVAG
jgi:peptide/nickel transport system permease protein